MTQISIFEKTLKERHRIRDKVIKATTSKYTTLSDGNENLVKIDQEVMEKRFFSTEKTRRYFGTEKIKIIIKEMKDVVEKDGEKKFVKIGVIGEIKTEDYTSTLLGAESLNRYDARIVYALVKLVQGADNNIFGVDGGGTSTVNKTQIVNGITVTTNKDMPGVLLTATKSALNKYLNFRDWERTFEFLFRLSFFKEHIKWKNKKKMQVNQMIMKIDDNDEQVKILLDKDFLERCTNGRELDYDILCKLDKHQHASALYEVLESIKMDVPYLSVEEDFIIAGIWGKNSDMRLDHMLENIKNAFKILQEKEVITSFIAYKQEKTRYWGYAYTPKFDTTPKITTEDLQKMILVEI